MMRIEQEMLNLIMEIAEEDERVRAVYIHGSRANPKIEKDDYADFDIAYVVTETGSFIKDTAWINSFGDITFIFEGYQNQNKFFMREVNDLSRRCVWSILFKDGNQIDLMIEIIDEAMNCNQIKNKPILILLDKDGCLPEMLPHNEEDEYVKKPYEDEYTACCTGFWWFLTNVAKGIARDQLPYAKEQFYSIILMTLNCMLNWYIGVQTDFSVSTGINNKYYKKYLPVEVYDLYTKIYSDSDYANFWNAVFSACELFSKTACNVGDYCGYTYNEQEENSMINYLNEIKNRKI